MHHLPLILPARAHQAGRRRQSRGSRHPLTSKLMKRLLTFLGAAALLAGCALAPPPPLTAASPASPEAPEGARVARQTSLRADDTTRKSRALLSAAQKEQEKWDDYGPVSGTPEDAPKSGMKMDGKMDMKNMEMKHDR